MFFCEKKQRKGYSSIRNLLCLLDFETFETDIFHLPYLSSWTNFWLFSSRQRAWKIFCLASDSIWLKSKVAFEYVAWVVQNSLFFPSLICQKKQLTQILDHSLKSVILRPQFLQGKMQKFRQNLSDGISGKIV